MELNPCPFCGMLPEVEQLRHAVGDPLQWYVECENVDCPAKVMAVHPKKERAFEVWNTRHTTEREQAMMEVIEAAQKLINETMNRFLLDASMHEWWELFGTYNNAFLRMDEVK